MALIKSKSFITENFLLNSKAAETLYHQYAKELPIIDYHNHLSPKLIAENQPIKNITAKQFLMDSFSSSNFERMIFVT